LPVRNWQVKNGRTELLLQLFPGGSVFIVLSKPARRKSANEGSNWTEYKTVKFLDGPWKVKFNPDFGGPVDTIHFSQLTDWTKHSESGIRYYSGTAAYSQTFTWNNTDNGQSRIWFELGSVANIAEVRVNNIFCGTAWTAPYQVEITNALHEGENKLVISVTNTWANRLTGDRMVPENKRITWTTAPCQPKDKPLLESGLLGPVYLVRQVK
jgi:hypothetical protein